MGLATPVEVYQSLAAEGYQLEHRQGLFTSVCMCVTLRLDPCQHLVKGTILFLSKYYIKWFSCIWMLCSTIGCRLEHVRAFIKSETRLDTFREDVKPLDLLTGMCCDADIDQQEYLNPKLYNPEAGVCPFHVSAHLRLQTLTFSTPSCSSSPRARLFFSALPPDLNTNVHQIE